MDIETPQLAKHEEVSNQDSGNEWDPNIRSRFICLSVPQNELSDISDIVDKMNLHGDCLATPYDGNADDSHFRFAAALAQAFDVDPFIVAQISNYDYLRAPDANSDLPFPNCAQALTMHDADADPTSELLSFLVSHAEPTYDEPYQHSASDMMRIRQAIVKIATEHKTAAEYFRFVSRRLWRTEDYLANNYASYMKVLQDRLDHCKRGLAFVFCGMSQHGRPLFV